jgi:dimethylaniline monooxygenase (N-oxide forming)
VFGSHSELGSGYDAAARNSLAILLPHIVPVESERAEEYFLPTVAVIGAGPGGLVAARWLKKEGFQPAIFEVGDRLGGQWAGDPRTSGVWPSMHTNTSRVLTEFSEVSHLAGTAVYPTNQQIQAYLQRYAEHFDLIPGFRFGTRVEQIDRGGEGRWIVRFRGQDGKSGEQTFSHVVVATGRYNLPAIPSVPGLESFSGSGGIVHTFAYKHPESYRGLRVLVAGCAISALEIASDLAMLGAARVIACNRRQRYVLNKLVAGVPSDHLIFTRFAALAGEAMPADVVAEILRDFIVRNCGSPDQFGAAKPDADLLKAGVTLSQFFLPLVAEGRIETKPWMTAVDGRTVHFADGSAAEVDAILFGTGYQMNLPFLSPAMRRPVNVSDHHMDLYKLTFHHDLPGLAFVGMFEQIGPYFPSLELQARWIAYVWSGARPLPASEEMASLILASRPQSLETVRVPFHAAATLFARAAGADPDPAHWPELARALLFGPLAPISYRLEGRDSLPDAPRLTAEAAAAFGAVTTRQLTEQQCLQLRGLADARKDASFSRLVETMTAVDSTY